LTTGKNIPKDFLIRDLRETAYISRKAREILAKITAGDDYVKTSSGYVTQNFAICGV